MRYCGQMSLGIVTSSMKGSGPTSCQSLGGPMSSLKSPEIDQLSVDL